MKLSTSGVIERSNEIQVCKSKKVMKFNYILIFDCQLTVSKSIFFKFELLMPT